MYACATRTSYSSSIFVVALLNCDGQDVAKKGNSKGRNRILTILPLQLGVGSKFTDCVLGNLRKFNTEAPELVMEVDGVRKCTVYEQNEVTTNVIISSNVLSL